MHPKRLLFAAALLAAGVLSAEAVRVGHTRADGYPLILPQPKELLPAAGSFALPAELPVAAPENFDLAPLAKVYAKTVMGGKVLPAKSGKALCRFEITTQGVPESVEGYTLTIAPEGITVKARDLRGLFYGMQTINWMLRNRDGAALKACRINDWPDLAMRGIFFELPWVPRQKTDRLCHVIDTLASLKYNMILIEFAHNFPLKNYPYTKHKDTFTREDVLKIMAAAKRNHIELVPMLQIASHTQWLMDHPDWEKMSEGKPSRPKRWLSTYCLSNPEVPPLVEAIVTETADLLKPRYYHFGLDEIYLCVFRKCPKCKAVEPLKLLVDHVRPFQKLLKDRGIRLMMFQDEYFSAGGSRRHALTEFPEAMGTDSVINSWEYSDMPNGEVGRNIRERGFKDLVYMTHSIRFGNCWRMPAVAKEMNAWGNILAYWYGMPATMDDANRTRAYSPASTVMQANYCWNTADVPPLRIPADLGRELFRALDDGFARPLPGKAAPLPLAGALNRTIGGDRLFPRLDAKLAAEAVKLAAADPAKFEVTASGDKLAAAVTASNAIGNLPTAPVTIPVGGVKFRGASFLFATALFNNIGPSTSYRERFNTGKLEFRYVDGSVRTQTLTLKNFVNDWNALVSGYHCRSVVRGDDLDGKLFHFNALEWRNPRPDVAVAEIRLSAAPDAGIAHALLAVSLHGAEPFHAVAETRTSLPALELPPLRFTSVAAEFSRGIPKGLIVTPTAAVGFRSRIVDDPVQGKVLECRFEGTGNHTHARLTFDVPIPADTDFRNAGFIVKVSDFSAIRRADLYFMDKERKGAEALFNFARDMSPDWYNIVIPRPMMTVREYGGVRPGYAGYLRIGFFLNPLVKKPFTISLAKAGFCEDGAIARSNVPR